MIFLAAFLLRLIYILEQSKNPTFAVPMVDEKWHLEWARDIIQRTLWGDEAYFRGPLYPYLLAFFLYITGDSLFWTRFIQILIGSGSAVLVFLIGRRIFGRNPGIIAGFITALYGTIIFYEAMFLIEVVYVFLLLAGFLMILKARESSRLLPWFGAGLVLGLAAIARPNILFIVPLILIWILFLNRKEIAVKLRIYKSAVYFVGLLLPVFIVAARNVAVTGEFILISSQGGVNLYIGNNPDADGLTMLMPEVKLDETLPWNEFTAATKRAAESETDRSLTAGEESSFWNRKAFSFILENPGQFLTLTFRKLVYFLVGFENSDNNDIYYTRNYSYVLKALLWNGPLYFPFGLLLPLAVVGVMSGWNRRRELSLLLIFIAGYIPTVILFLVTARHRLPVIPFMAVLAGAGIWYLKELAGKKDWKKLTLVLIAPALILIIFNQTYFEIGFQNLWQVHFNQALAYEKLGDLPAAEKEYLAALADNPHSPVILNNLGYVQFLLTKYDDALVNYKRAVKADPGYVRALNNAAMVYEIRDDLPHAESLYVKAIQTDPQMYQAYLNLGDLFLKTNRPEEFEATLLETIKRFPDKPEAYFKLGSFYGQIKEYALAETNFREGLRLGRPRTSDYINWGNIYFATERPEEALQLYRQALTSDPNQAQAYFNMALTFQRYGYPRDSIIYYCRKTLEINPQYTPARQLLSHIGG